MSKRACAPTMGGMDKNSSTNAGKDGRKAINFKRPLDACRDSRRPNRSESYSNSAALVQVIGRESNRNIYGLIFGLRNVPLLFGAVKGIESPYPFVIPVKAGIHFSVQQDGSPRSRG